MGVETGEKTPGQEYQSWKAPETGKKQEQEELDYAYLSPEEAEKVFGSKERAEKYSELSDPEQRKLVALAIGQEAKDKDWGPEATKVEEISDIVKFHIREPHIQDFMDQFQKVGFDRAKVALASMYEGEAIGAYEKRPRNWGEAKDMVEKSLDRFLKDHGWTRENVKP